MISKRLLHLPGARMGASLLLALLQTIGALAEVLLLPVAIAAVGRSLGLPVPHALAWVPGRPGLLAALIGGLILVRLLAQAVAKSVSARLADGMGKALSQALYLSVFDPNRQEDDLGVPAQTLARLSTEGVKSVVSYFTAYIPALVQTALMLVVALAVLLPVSPLAAVIVVIGMVALPLASKPTMGENIKVQLGQLRKYDKVGVHFEHALRGLNTLKIFGADQRQADDLAEESEGFRRITMGVLGGQLRSLIKADVVIYTSLILAVAATVLIGQGGSSRVLSCLVVALAGVRLFAPERQLVYMMHSGMVAIKQGKAIDDILQARQGSNRESAAPETTPESGKKVASDVAPATIPEAPEEVYPGTSLEVSEKAARESDPESASGAGRIPASGSASELTLDAVQAPVSGSADVVGQNAGSVRLSSAQADQADMSGDDSPGIRARNLTYTYPDGFQALTDLNFDLPAKGHVGLVGASGSGKSTLAGLLSGRLQGYTGELTIGRRQIGDLSREDLVGLQTVVRGTDRLFTGTIRSNLDPAGLGYSDWELQDALDQVGLTGLVQSKGGLNALIDPEGGNLSGGQRQRLSIARGLLRRSPVYIFDEATSAVDREHDATLAALMDALGKESLVLTITHRLAGVRNADAILFLQGGRLMESGGFRELMDAGGGFAAQWKEQAQYEDGE
ncbi:ATP-binding cassette domain-containing protein [Bifidobacterium sp. W8101]|uniref:ATP-binding cassette domain-containing protein n=1 Tax=Bifidobacterium TaxID=1678 RepID=UPI0018DBF78D|nr:MULTISPECIES: ATP-binding cassette domain-containing protein [Bifidobacterium]MBI0126187.1 ATP-binding cassette domain-containing protein [Bifidobacterium choladohabitans]MBI0127756.1 ATP-binding cassette domain-containing protein [Bifidobacterium sp. W8103]MBI0138344.1 ATP-binding cassette domain-containing protein [Bifidobacterium sp. W8105]MBI0148686.1 ATP-binding cassette domain-containing protein [Bifidobacterium sp. W8107]